MNLGSIKKLSVSIGLYRAARTIKRRLSKSQMDVYRADLEFYRKLLPGSGVLCFDVGANVGRVAEVLLGLGNKVIAFEPQPYCIAEMTALCAPYRDRLTIEPMGISDAPGEAPLFIGGSSGQSSLSSTWEGLPHATLSIPLSTLDRAIEKFGVPYYCKIDVEGWELNVLRGLSRPLPLVSFEYHSDGGRMEAAYACLERLNSLGKIAVNLTPREQSVLSLPDWVEVEDFPSIFEKIAAGNERFVYGDIYVRTAGL